MGIILLVLLNLICIGLDVVIFFLLVRLILLWWSVRWLELLNAAGKQLVDALAANIGGLWHRVTLKRLSERGELVVSLFSLSLVRLLLCEIARFL